MATEEWRLLWLPSWAKREGLGHRVAGTGFSKESARENAIRNTQGDSFPGLRYEKRTVIPAQYGEWEPTNG